MKKASYQWRKKCSGMGVNEAKRLKELEEGNRGLKKIVYMRGSNLSQEIRAKHFWELALGS